MKFNIGDRVKFLNEQGGGVVSKVISPSLVEVTTSDGFEIPYATKEIIPLIENTHAEKLFNSDVADTKDIKVVHEEKETYDYPSSDNLILYPSQRIPEKFSAWLAFVPHDQKWLITGIMDVYFINYSDASIHFTIFKKNDTEYSKLASAEANPFSRFYIAEISRDDISEWEDIVVQSLVLPLSSKVLYAPVDTQANIRGSKFYRETSYQVPEFMKEKAVLFNLFKFNQLPVMHKINVVKDKKEEVVTTKVKQPQRNDAILEHIVSEGKAEVDMHIWKLVSDETSLNKHEKFLTQLDYFNKCLDSAIAHHLDKVVFIHGVGSGKLKEEIKHIMDDKEIFYKPASMAEYGVGATEVKIPQNYF